MIVVNKEWIQRWTYKLRSPNFCRLTLNYIALEYNERGVIVRMLQLRFECGDGNKLWWELLLAPPPSRPRGIKSFPSRIQDNPPKLSRTCYPFLGVAP